MAGHTETANRFAMFRRRIADIGFPAIDRIARRKRRRGMRLRPPWPALESERAAAWPAAAQRSVPSIAPHWL